MVEEATSAPFSEEVLEHIAGLISGTRSGSEITRFFQAAGYSEFVHDGSTKKWFVLDCLGDLNRRTDGAYHVIKVVEKLVDPKQYISAPQTHRAMVEELNKALVFHGLVVNASNRVVLSKEPPPRTPLATPSGKAEIDLFNRIALHPEIRGVSEALFHDGHYAQAIFEAFKAVNNAVKSKSGLSDKDGQSLMAAAFAGDPPPLALNAMRTQSERDEQDGFKFLFMGAMAGIRNPKAHETIKQDDPYRTLHYLAFASLLMTRVDEAHVRIRVPANRQT